MTIGDRIRALRISHSMSAKELGDKLGITEAGERYWESGARRPSADAIVALANIFEVSTDYILGVNIGNKPLSTEEHSLISKYNLLDQHGKDVVNSVLELEVSRVIQDRTSLPKQRVIPLYITPAAAGQSFPLDDNAFEFISVNDNVPANASFAVKIQGNSMLPKIHDGDTVFIQREANLNNGDIGIFGVDGAMYCKQYRKDNTGNVHLISLNPEYAHTNVTIKSDSSSDFRYFGKVLF